MLRDATGLAARDIRSANRIEQRSLAVIDVTHDGDHRSARQFDIVGIGGDQFFELFFRNHLFERHEGNFVTKSFAEIDGHIVVQRLIDGGEDTALQAAGSRRLSV